MPHWWPGLLLVVFVTHWPFFALRWWRKREARFLATAITLTLLVATYALRVFAADASLQGVPLFWWVRVPAWLAALVSICLLVHHHVRGGDAGRAPVRPPPSP
jgi:hypothetical protein